MRRAAAGAHVEAVHGEARFQARLRNAAHVAGFARALQAMRQDDLSQRLARRPLRLHQYLDTGLGAVELRFHRIAFGIQAARPEIAGHGEEVVVGYDGTERPQTTS